jgi:hypothetical protein
MDVVKKELGEKPTEEEWRAWISKWNKLSVEDFLRSDIYQSDQLEHKQMPGSHACPCGYKLRPWPEDAIAGYKVVKHFHRIQKRLFKTVLFRLIFGKTTIK